ncbi:MAG: phenylalanine--tRNA ligase subunit beta, partial [Synergistales bacterium]|nr:phenylalanine--tRNA ligase subunit beta [Synergistales bacterium]MDY6429222.1 phenylalanine--tRNA ligase subunit beta [Synergistales bacterium]
MLVSWELLKNFIDIEPLDLTPEALAERLTFSGAEVEGITYTAGKMKGVVAARVDALENHTAEKKYLVAHLNTGSGEHVCVTSATNVKKGDLVFYAGAGAVLPNGMELGTRDFHGVESSGMMLSAEELGLHDVDDPSGLLILPNDAKPGDKAENLYHIGDVILDVSITPNRGDLLSILGMAREIKGLYPKSILKNPEWLNPLRQDQEWNEDFGSISLPDKGCLCYRLGLATGARMVQSPLTIKIDLAHLGMRPIINAVDVTNYVMMMLGQPLHAFDLNTLPAREITVRAAHEGEKMMTLDGKERLLTEKDMLITSGGEAIALAGVMGGEQTGINGDTSTIVIESACFSPVRVGHTSRRLGINSEAAFRFSRTVDPNLSKTALLAATNLIKEWCGAEVSYKPLSAENEISAPKPVKLTRKKLSTYLSWGNMSEAEKILDGFGIKYINGNDDEKIFMPPTSRPDITIEEDLIEEVGRFIGYNDVAEKLPGELPRRADIGSGMELSGFVRNSLIARGYTEVVTYSFLPEDFPEKLRLSSDDVRAKPLKIANPISRDQMAMRTTLLPGLLMGLKTAVTSGWRDPVRIFEQGKIFLFDNTEIEHVAGILFNGADTRSPFDNRAENFYNIKADVEALIMSRGFTPVFKAGQEPFTHAGQTADIFINENKIGFVARLKPSIEQELDVSGVYAFEIDLTLLVNKNKPVFTPSSQFPASFRDISLLVSIDKSNDEVMRDISSSVREAAGNELTLEKLRLFDIYEG